MKLNRKQIIVLRAEIEREQRKREKLHHRGIVSPADHGYLISRIDILHNRIRDIINEKRIILNDNNAGSYIGIMDTMSKERYRLLNKERKSIQDTFDKINQILFDQERERFYLGMCEKL